jgi:hypothetical protein
MSVPKFDIFRGALGSTDLLWIEAVEGLGAAKQRMDEIAREQPGRYFVFYSHERTVLASTNTELGFIDRDLKVG